MYSNARDAWNRLDTQRTGLLNRCEVYASLTVPKVCLPKDMDPDSYDESHDYQSVGAVGVNHLANKLMLAMFSPSRPFPKLDPKRGMVRAAQVAKLTEVQLHQILAEGERKAVAALDTHGQRPKLYSCLRHLIVTGNALLHLDAQRKQLRVTGLRNYVVQRDIEGRVKHLVIRELVNFGELAEAVRTHFSHLYQDDSKVEFFKWIKTDDGSKYTMTQWVNNHQLPKAFDGRWPVDELPYRVLTWDLADEANYGTGLVEEYIGDIRALSTLSQSVVEAGVLVTEFRTLVNPNGITSVDDVQNSKNGDALPGAKDDVSSMSTGDPQAITSASGILDKYERRVSRAFLVSSAVIRDAERVTQEEIRLTAQELNTTYGGVYSTLGESLQKPVARWLFKIVGLPTLAADVEITIVTGLDALSRGGDLDNFRVAMSDMRELDQLPEAFKARINWEAVAALVGSGRGVDFNKLLLTAEQVEDNATQAAASRVEEQAAAAAGIAAAQGTQE